MRKAADRLLSDAGRIMWLKRMATEEPLWFGTSMRRTVPGPHAVPADPTTSPGPAQRPSTGGADRVAAHAVRHLAQLAASAPAVRAAAPHDRASGT